MYINPKLFPALNHQQVKFSNFVCVEIFSGYSDCNDVVNMTFYIRPCRVHMNDSSVDAVAEFINFLDKQP